jgi:hypothetical protein
MGTTNNNFWQNPPWGNGDRKYRLGLKPIEIDKWLDRAIGKDLLKHKLDLFKSKYNQVVAATTDSNEAQKYLAEIFDIQSTNYPDLIAEISLNIQDDLCLVESHGEQRLLAASICSPSYWDLRTKIGKPLKQIHDPVTTLEEKIGDRISTFIRQSPLMKPFARQNWLIHGDTKRFHLEEEKLLMSDPSTWFIRSEKETLCRFHEDYSLFTINVLFEPLNKIFNYPEIQKALIRSLESFDEDEAIYFGGIEKINTLLEYLKA